jgi:hypothetical protein
MGWAGNGAHMGEMRNSYKIFVETVFRRDLAKDLCVGWTLILK